MHRSGFAGDLTRLDEMLIDHPEWRSRLTVIHHDLCDPIASNIGTFTYILHVAASSHVDRSILDPKGFLRDNVEGTVNLLEYARKRKPKRFLYFSTDEVYGNAPDTSLHTESFPHRPRNPYAASKAAAEDFCQAYLVTYNVPIIITNTMNIIGERQHLEKFVPLILRALLTGKTLNIHGHPDKQRPGQRFYLHARNAAAGMLFVLKHGNVGERYNVVGEEELDNLQMATLVACFANEWRAEQGLPELPLNTKIVDFQASRPGHDLRYALDGSKLAALGYTHPLTLRTSLRNSVRWTLENQDRWLTP